MYDRACMGRATFFPLMRLCVCVCVCGSSVCVCNGVLVVGFKIVCNGVLVVTVCFKASVFLGSRLAERVSCLVTCGRVCIFLWLWCVWCVCGVFWGVFAFWKRVYQNLQQNKICACRANPRIILCVCVCNNITINLIFKTEIEYGIMRGFWHGMHKLNIFCCKS